jgi:hypothetical protein
MAQRKQIMTMPHTESQRRFKGNRAPTVKYDSELADYICEQIAMGRSLNRICAEDRVNMPSAAAVVYWAMNDFGPGFRAKYQLACTIRQHLHEDELIDIADDGTNDWYEREGKDGQTTLAVNYENIQRSHLRFKCRQFLISNFTLGKSTMLPMDPAKKDLASLPEPPTIVIVPTKVMSK